MELDAPVVEARLDQGVLTLDAVTGKLFGGDLLMSGALDVGDVPDLSLTYALKDSRFADVLEATLGHGIIDGQGSVAGAFSAKGNSQFDMVSSVSGQSRVHIQNGALIGVDLPGLVRGLKGASSAKGLGALAFNAFSSGQTPFTDMTVDLQAQKGLVQMAPMRAALAAGQMESRASLDLGAWALSMTGTFRLEDYPDAPPIGFDLGGAVSNPTIALDTDPLLRWRASQLATSVFKRLDIPGSDLLKAPDVVGTKQDRMCR
ncbi:hypothetical protein JCM17845_24210 [Iodidimonas gelatinilytica]|uniref:AsmA domain-containing protein n=1 Tax=Iodidimonas gelatinilytica TaxID=1236966 RepID=A0A5A7N103_9PROT|nr:AsmA-like C-terminal region-containing protein [Iodidimonas gelatinilytica]GER01798.1 hypothetical protein JCM17845_24210 [Iodidimonas gelatinilytica]